MVLETSWGLLYTVLLPVPLLAWALRPAGWVGPQIVGIAAAVLAAGMAAAAWGQVFVAFLVAASAAFPRMWRPQPKWSFRLALARPAFWPVDALVGLAVGAALVHVWEVVDAARSGVRDDETWYLMHLPMQAAFALAVPAAAMIGVLALANGVGGWWFAIVPPAGCAMWFGAVSIKYPDAVGSLGDRAGRFVLAWGCTVAVALWTTGFLTSRLDGGRELSGRTLWRPDLDAHSRTASDAPGDEQPGLWTMSKLGGGPRYIYPNFSAREPDWQPRL